MNFLQDNKLGAQTNDDSSAEVRKEWADLESSSAWKLPVDIYETEDSIIIISLLAGVDAKDLSITLHNDIITIKGSVVQDGISEDSDCLYQECVWGDFSRSVVLPCQVQTNNVQASFKRHILTVVLTKQAESDTTNIKVAVDDTE